MLSPPGPASGLPGPSVIQAFGLAGSPAYLLPDRNEVSGEVITNIHNMRVDRNWLRSGVCFGRVGFAEAGLRFLCGRSPATYLPSDAGRPGGDRR